MTIEAEIARRICEEIREEARRNRSVRVPLKIAEYHRVWPTATSEQIFRGVLIAYEMLILDVAETIWGAPGKAPKVLPVFNHKSGDEGAEN